MARNKEFDETEVLRKARDLFWERGYSATSIHDLEAGLGISRSSLYRFFGGKRELYDRTLADYRDDNLQRLGSALGQSDDLRQELASLFVAAARREDVDCTAGARGCYIVNATTEMANACADAFRFVSDNRDRFVEVMRAALEAAQRRGRLHRAADVLEWANFLFLFYNGLQVVVQTGIDKASLERAVERCVDALPWTD